MNHTAAVITVSDRAFRGERTDTSGPAVAAMLRERGWQIARTATLPDEGELIRAELIKCADELGISLVLTTGGTGFSPRDVTPEATLAVVQREARGIPEAMRWASMQLTPRACLSRAAAGIRGGTLIVNLPGSERAAVENLSAVIDALGHGVEMLLSSGSADCGAPTGKVLAVCISQRKGEQKHPVPSAQLLPELGIPGDAHAGNWHRQLSLLAAESVAKVQRNIDFSLTPGAFAENILTEGLCLYELPVGTRLRIGPALCQVTQIGKECHSDCAIRKAAGDCVMPREGIFAKVLEGGVIRAGDSIQVIL